MVFSSTIGSLPIALLLLIQPALSEYTTTNNSALHDNSPNCSCYVVNSGSGNEYFQYHRFFDFRNLASRPGQFLKNPPLINHKQNASELPVWDADILNSTGWNADWGIQSWGKDATDDFPTPMTNSLANVYIGQNDDAKDWFTWLTLRTSRLEDYQSAAEIESEQKNLMHASLRMQGRVIGSKGAVAGFFTFYDDDNESDIEILTNDPTNKIRYTNQPSLDKDGNEVQVASQAPSNLAPWDQWQMHRIDWLPKNSYWYLNGQQVSANTYSVPRKESYLVLNMWSDGGEWSGNMTEGDSAEFQIQWIELIFNTSGPVEGAAKQDSKRSVDLLGKREEKGCEVVCKVDDVKETGHPEVISVKKGAAVAVSMSWGVLVGVAIVSVMVGL
jgi:hypothetical protein